MSRLAAFLAELKRRRVYHVAVVYAAAAVAAAQAADVFFPRLNLPDWTVTVVVVLAAAGFPVAMLLGWVFDITPAGVRRTGPPPEASGATVARLGYLRLIGGSAAGLVLLLAGGWWLSMLAFRPAPTIDRLAVLPLASLTSDPEQVYFAHGIHDALISELAQAGVAVIARTSVLQYEDTRKSVREIARELNVGAVIEGSVLQAGDNVRIRVQLIDGATEAHLWAQTYEGALRDVLALHRQVTRAVARQIRMSLSPQAHARLRTERPVDPDAYRAYLRGMRQLERGTWESREAALAHFNDALAMDSTFALPYIGIYRVWAGRRQFGIVPPEEATPKIRAALRAAFDLDDQLAEVHYALAAHATWTDWNWVAAESSFRRAIELNPHHAETRVSYAHFLHIMQRPDEAVVQARRALQLDPMNPLIHALAGGAFLMARDYDEALARFQTVLRLAPGSANGFIGLSNTLHYLERYDEAFAAERDNAGTGRGDAELADALNSGYAEGGYRAAMRGAAELLAERSLSVHVQSHRVARYYLRAAEHEHALDWLERAYAARDPGMPYISTGHKDFDVVRDHPRFRALLRSMNLSE